MHSTHGFRQPGPRSTLVVYATVSLPAAADILDPGGKGDRVEGTAVALSPMPKGWETKGLGSGEYEFMTPSSGACFHVTVEQGTKAAAPRGLDSPADEKWSLGIDSEIEQRLRRRAWAISISWDIQHEDTAGEPRGVAVDQLRIADKLGELSRGAIGDVEGRRYFVPWGWRFPGGSTDRWDVRDYVTVHHVPMPGEGGAWVHTHGAVKFGRAEFEIFDVKDSLRETAAALLWEVVDRSIDGPGLRPLDRAGSESFPVLIRRSMRSPAAHFHGPVLELVDLVGRGRPAERGAPMALAAKREKMG